MCTYMCIFVTLSGGPQIPEAYLDIQVKNLYSVCPLGDSVYSHSFRCVQRLPE